MIVISHHVKTMGIEYPKDAVVRINLAWLESEEEFDKILNSLHEYKVWLDYPTGRTKPPKPKFGFEEAIKLTKNPSVHFFAFSNAEDSGFIGEIRKKVPDIVIHINSSVDY